MYMYTVCAPVDQNGSASFHPLRAYPISTNRGLSQKEASLKKKAVPFRVWGLIMSFRKWKLGLELRPSPLQNFHCVHSPTRRFSSSPGLTATLASIMCPRKSATMSLSSIEL